MGLIDTFSKRKRRAARAGQPDVYQYDSLPQPFRMQVMYIWKDALGPYVRPAPYVSTTASTSLWAELAELTAREAGLPYLGDDRHDDPMAQCQKHLGMGTVDDALDIIELSFRAIDLVARKLPDYQRAQAGMTQSADDGIAELNARFKEHSIGYQYEIGILIRMDSEFLHAEVVRPALQLLNESGFAGVEAEFLKAHEHYRAGRTEETLTECLKAFESTIKTVCDLRRWRYLPTATAKDLVAIVFEKGLLPDFMLSKFTALRSVLESGVPTIRNRTAGHGQGSEVRTNPRYLAGYVLHLTAANILLLVEAHKAKA
jgi:hypothetical protein